MCEQDDLAFIGLYVGVAATLMTSSYGASYNRLSKLLVLRYVTNPVSTREPSRLSASLQNPDCI